MLEVCQHLRNKRYRESSVHLPSFGPIQVVDKATADMYESSLFGVWGLGGRVVESVWRPMTKRLQPWHMQWPRLSQDGGHDLRTVKLPILQYFQVLTHPMLPFVKECGQRASIWIRHNTAPHRPDLWARRSNWSAWSLGLFIAAETRSIIGRHTMCRYLRPVCLFVSTSLCP